MDLEILVNNVRGGFTLGRAEYDWYSTSVKKP